MDIPMKLTSLFGNPDQMYDPSVYSNVLNTSIGASQNVVRIQTNIADSVIKGLLISPLKFNIAAEWDSAGLLEAITSNGLMGTVAEYATMIMAAGGRADPTNLGISSQKIYKNSGYLEFDVNFRIVDWQGKGEPLYCAFILSSMCLPTKSEFMTARQAINAMVKRGEQLAGKVLGFIFNKPVGANNMETLGAAATTDIANITKWTETLIGKGIEGVEEAIPEIKPILDKFDAKDFFVLATSPSPIAITIGSYFHHTDIITKSVSTELSKECTTAGPLYADFSLSFSSRKAMLIGDDINPMGFTRTNLRPRVTRQQIKTKAMGQAAFNASPIATALR